MTSRITKSAPAIYPEHKALRGVDEEKRAKFASGFARTEDEVDAIRTEGKIRDVEGKHFSRGRTEEGASIRDRRTALTAEAADLARDIQIGRASCRERV